MCAVLSERSGSAEPIIHPVQRLASLQKAGPSLVIVPRPTPYPLIAQNSFTECEALDFCVAEYSLLVRRTMGAGMCGIDSVHAGL